MSKRMIKTSFDVEGRYVDGWLNPFQCYLVFAVNNELKMFPVHFCVWRKIKKYVKDGYKKFYLKYEDKFIDKDNQGFFCHVDAHGDNKEDHRYGMGGKGTIYKKYQIKYEKKIKR